MTEALGGYKTRDGKSLSFRKWSGIRDVIIYLHGIESNSGWFSPFASRLNKEGFTLYGIDRRGSGFNNGDKGHISDYNIFLDDIEDALKFIKAENIGKKVFLMGICWGGLLASNYVTKRTLLPDGLILLSPAIYRKVDLNFFVKFIVRFCSLFYPKFHFKIPIKDEMFTSNKECLDFIKKDAMRVRTLTPKFFSEILRMEKELPPDRYKIDMPLAVFLAGHDEIIDNEKVGKWFKGLKSNDKTIKVFDDLRHVMPFEDNIDPLIYFITNWIKTKGPVFESHSLKS